MLIDAGCEYRGYAGDITYRPSGEQQILAQPQRQFMTSFWESLETALELYRPGTSIRGEPEVGAHHDHRTGLAWHPQRRRGHPDRQQCASSVLYAAEPLAGAGCA